MKFSERTAGGGAWYRCAEGVTVTPTELGSIVLTTSASSPVGAAGVTRDGSYVYVQYSN